MARIFFETLPELSQAQVLPMLGFADATAVPPDMLQQVQDACAVVRQKAAARGVYRYLPRSAVQDCVQGRDITQHLQGCSQVVLLAVTLGIEIDVLLRHAQTRNMAYALLLDTAASVYLEQLAQLAESMLTPPEGMYQTGRYSPGYGDWALCAQRQLLHLLDAPRAIGLTMTDSFLLTPCKSITAICGVAEHPVIGQLAGCASCALRLKCQFRKEGKTCDTSNN